MNDAVTRLVLGIDLGTTNSLIAIADGAGPRVLAGDGAASMPSVVRFDGAGEVVAVGASAIGAEGEEFSAGEVVVSSVKRLMGRSLKDAKGDLGFLGYEVVEGANETARVRVGGQSGGESGGKTVTPQEVSARILEALKERAIAALGDRAGQWDGAVVVTVPAYFDDGQRQATRDAGRLAGLEVVRIVNEPTAAALAYGIGVGSSAEEQTVAVYDLGGGTFDVSILRVIPAEEGSEEPVFFQVLSTAGDTRLGGDDFDHALMAWFEAKIGRELPSGSKRGVLKRIAERAKIALSEVDAAQISVRFGDEVVEASITRAEFEGLIQKMVQRTIDRCAQALRDAGVGAQEVDRVVLVGGSTRVPMVRRVVGEFFGMSPYTAIDPDQVVALGAAVQGRILGGDRSALLMDVVPLSLGLETVGGAVAKLVMKNSSVPARATEMFSTSVDGQVSIKLNVVQGEREMVVDCRSLGVFHLKGIPPMPAGIPQVEVEFLVDANGVLRVSAVEKRSGKRADLDVVPSFGLTREEVDRIEAESFKHAKEDMQRHRVVDLIVNSKLDLKWIRERVEAVGDELDAGYRAELELRIDELAGFVARAEAQWDSVVANDFYAAKQGLDQASMRLHEVSIAKSLRGG